MKQVTHARALLIGATLAGSLQSATSYAQEADASASGDIIVTARRLDERLQDVPISITVYNQAQLSNRNVVTATDLAIYTPSLTVNQRYGPEKASFSIRGFVQENATAPSVGVYLADVAFGRAQGGTTSGGNAPVGSFMDLQNVQVLKGPQGTLFGRNTTGGAVLLVPQKPTAQLEGYLEGSVGDYNMRRAQAMLNVPLADTFRVRLAVDRQKRDGYMRNHSGVGPRTYNDTNYFAARLSILADLTPDLENYTIATYSHSFSNGYGARIVACNPNRFSPTGSAISASTLVTAFSGCDQIARQNARGDGPLDVEINNPDPFINLRHWQVIDTTTWKPSETLTIKNIASYQEFRERASFSLNGDNFFVSNPPPSLASLGIAASLTPGLRYNYILINPTGPTGNNSAESTFSEEFQLQGRTGDNRLTWQAGGYLSKSRPISWNSARTGILATCTSPQELQCANTLFIGQISQGRTKYSFDTTGLYAQATYKPLDQLSVTGGFRYTWDKIRAAAENTRFVPPSTLQCNDPLHFPGTRPGSGKVVTDQSQCHFQYPDAKSHAPTWLVDLDYRPTEDLLFYAKYARGYRQGGINSTNVGLESWDPEKVDAYEIGAKASFRGSINGYLNVAGFYNDFSRQQLVASAVSNVPGFAGAQPVVNAGRSRLKGFEVDASATFFQSLRFDVGYTYLNTLLKSFTPPTIPLGAPYGQIISTALVGGPLALSPKNRITVTGTYTLPLDDQSIGKISLGATFVHTDSQYFNRADDQFIPYLTPGAVLPVSGGVQQVPFTTANFPLYSSNLGLLPPTNILNININWNNVMGSRVDAAFFMTNVTNDIYPVGVGGSANSAGFENFLYGAPRMWGFRLRYSFGG